MNFSIGRLAPLTVPQSTTVLVGPLIPVYQLPANLNLNLQTGILAFILGKVIRATNLVATNAFIIGVNLTQQGGSAFGNDICYLYGQAGTYPVMVGSSGGAPTNPVSAAPNQFPIGYQVTITNEGAGDGTYSWDSLTGYTALIGP